MEKAESKFYVKNWASPYSNVDSTRGVGQGQMHNQSQHFIFGFSQSLIVSCKEHAAKNARKAQSMELVWRNWQPAIQVSRIKLKRFPKNSDRNRHIKDRVAHTGGSCCLETRRFRDKKRLKILSRFAYAARHCSIDGSCPFRWHCHITWPIRVGCLWRLFNRHDCHDGRLKFASLRMHQMRRPF